MLWHKSASGQLEARAIVRLNKRRSRQRHNGQNKDPEIRRDSNRAETDGKLLERQKNLAAQAHVIVGASAKAGITGLVYALAGYTPTPEEVITAFKFYVREEARDYEREFPTLPRLTETVCLSTSCVRPADKGHSR